MTPESNRQPVEENFSATNITTGLNATNDSDSEDEDAQIAGYMPLSQNPADIDTNLADLENDDNEWIAAPVITNETLALSAESNAQDCPVEVRQVWESTRNRSDIDLDSDKIDQVKTVMASFSLPNTSIPEWANSISEEQWKEQLMERIRRMQQRDT